MCQQCVTLTGSLSDAPFLPQFLPCCCRERRQFLYEYVLTGLTSLGQPKCLKTEKNAKLFLGDRLSPNHIFSRRERTAVLGSKFRNNTEKYGQVDRSATSPDTGPGVAEIYCKWHQEAISSGHPHHHCHTDR